MIEKVVKIKKDKDSISDDLEYWLKKSPEERVSAVDFLRLQYHGSGKRLRRVAEVIKRP
jgi:hypothetical protein